MHELMWCLFKIWHKKRDDMAYMMFRDDVARKIRDDMVAGDEVSCSRIEMGSGIHRRAYDVSRCLDQAA